MLREATGNLTFVRSGPAPSKIELNVETRTRGSMQSGVFFFFSGFFAPKTTESRRDDRFGFLGAGGCATATGAASALVAASPLSKAALELKA